MLVSGTVLWCVAALVVVGLEMFAGTVYLLAVAAGAAVAAFLSFLDFSFSAELFGCGVTTVLGAVAVRSIRRRMPEGEAEAIQKLDVGQRVFVEAVRRDGTSEVRYRGAPWRARSESGALSRGTWTIVRVDGTELVLGERVAD